jgi:hypothetical protein
MLEEMVFVVQHLHVKVPEVVVAQELLVQTDHQVLVVMEETEFLIR